MMTGNQRGLQFKKTNAHQGKHKVPEKKQRKRRRVTQSEPASAYILGCAGNTGGAAEPYD